MLDKIVKFKEIPIGGHLDFVSERIGYNSFFLECVKIGSRKYKDSSGNVHKIGSVNCVVRKLS